MNEHRYGITEAGRGMQNTQQVAKQQSLLADAMDELARLDVDLDRHHGILREAVNRLSGGEPDTPPSNTAMPPEPADYLGRLRCIVGRISISSGGIKRQLERMNSAVG